ncbi:hypothetical protein Tco_0823216 [Tanacetum coccineum]|uniref:Uncharacterized protein n=1 Tax=Tanacetum coccineum TaxID=301880 RepID=A0ABQ5AKA6_9ASTR
MNENKGIMPTKVELTLEQSQQGVSNDVLSPTHYPCDFARTFRVILFSIQSDEWKSFQSQPQTTLRGSYALSWKPCQGDSLNLPDHSHIPPYLLFITNFQMQHQDSRIKKAQEFKTKTSANSDIQDLPLRYQVYQGGLLASFQDDANYEQVGQDTRSQGGKDDQDKQGKDLEISKQKTKLKDNDKGKRSKIT